MINGFWLGGTVAPGPATATADRDELLKMATRIQTGSHMPQVNSVSTACSA